MTIRAVCSSCGRDGAHKLNEEETARLKEYRIKGTAMGMLQNIFPDVPAWIRSGAIDTRTGGFCICPECAKEGV